ncbi:MAG: tRNA (N(6)-L-threonylcarbamoyladenosine(37)-C(2))-methylthiotransferase MtaB [Dehalococcoidia bacterium]|jgi:threonylcarbamoyladenosine tRNA methylthiotransferase MtaB
MQPSSAKTTAVAIETLGCKLNQAESESLALQFAEMGCRLVSPSESVDIYILNTCTVTRTADRKSRYLLRLARRRNPHATIIAIGCYADRDTEELDKLKCADFILSNNEKENLPTILGLKRRQISHDTCDSDVLRTRSMIKIQEGCDHFCSYCIVPYVRGRERSIPPDEIIEEIKSRISMGFKEVVLTGTKIGAYKPGLELLIKRILDQTSVRRIRLSSLQPGDITDELLDIWNDARLCRHLHLPLQSGSDSVLTLMNRPYNTSAYETAVERIRKTVPQVSITTDIIVGFPGETGEEFEESYRFCKHMAFANMHVFSYSERPGTTAASMPDQIDEKIKKDRSRKMMRLARESAVRFSEQFCRKTLPVLWETEISPGVWDGLTDNYIRVMTHSSRSLKNEIIEAKLVGTYNKLLKCTEADLVP